MPIVFTSLPLTLRPATGTPYSNPPLSVGMPVEFIAAFTTDVPVAGGIIGLAGDLYATVDLFVPVGSPAPPMSLPAAPYWVWALDGTTTANTVYDMNFAGSNPQENGEVSFEVDNSGANFVIRFAGWFVLLEDTNGTGAVQNQRRLLFNSVGSPTVLANSVVSIFRQNRNLRLNLRHFVNPATWTGATAARVYSSRWYNSNVFALPPITLKNLSVDLTIGGNPVAGIGSIDNTRVDFSLESIAVNPRAWVYLIRTDTVDASQNWQGNYAGAYAALVTQLAGPLTLPAPYDSRIVGLPSIIGPSTALAPSAPGEVAGSFTIDSTEILAGAKYRLVFVVFHDEPAFTTDSYSFISDEFETYNLAQPCPIGLEGRIKDYRTEHPDILLNAAPYERLRFETDWAAAPFEACRPSQSVQQNATQISVSIYEEAGTTRHVFADYLAMKTNVTNMQSTEGSLRAVWDPALETWFAGLDLRVRWEDNLPNLYDLDTLTNTQNPPTQTQDWAGRVLWVQWSFLLKNGVNEDEFIFRQKIEVTSVDSCFNWELRDSAGNPINTFCEELDAVQICVFGCSNWLSGDQLIFAAIPADYPLFRLREYDPNLGILPQLDQPPIFQAAATWDAEGRACFSVDATQMQELVQYRFVVIRKPFIAPPDVPCTDCLIYVGIPLAPFDLHDLFDCFLHDMGNNFLS